MPKVMDTDIIEPGSFSDAPPGLLHVREELAIDVARDDEGIVGDFGRPLEFFDGRLAEVMVFLPVFESGRWIIFDLRST